MQQSVGRTGGRTKLRQIRADETSHRTTCKLLEFRWRLPEEGFHPVLIQLCLWIPGGFEQADESRAGRQLQFGSIDKENQHGASNQRLGFIDIVAGNAHSFCQPQREIDRVAVLLAERKFGTVFSKRDRIGSRLLVEIGALAFW